MSNPSPDYDPDKTLPPPTDAQLSGTPPDETQAYEDQLVDILDRYLSELKAGTAPSRDELIRRHPQLAERLEACLAGLEFIHRTEQAGPDSPQRLGDFRLLREVGRGGMGAVYEAEQISLGRRVAVKVLRFGAVSDPEAVDRFRREAETVARLHHTNIVPIFFVGSEGGVNYYAMQFIEGRSLAEVLAQRTEPLEVQTVADWGLQAAEALAHAHQRDVIHRDVKPSNLLLDGEGRIWLTDFGLAKRLDDVTLSMTGALLGTPRYMSPEQASAARHRMDHRTDLYSLGATLYELATGQPVFSGDTPHQLISQILNQEPAPPRRLRPDLPRDLETVLLRCLAKEPEQRYANSRALADDLRAVLDGRPIRARRAGMVERGVKWARRHRRSLTLAGGSVAATVAVVLLGLLSAVWYGHWRLARVALDTDQPPLVAEIIAEAGDIAARQTVPTQQRIEVPAGNYRLRVSGEGRLSESFLLSLDRGNAPKITLNLEERLLARPIEVPAAHRIVEADGGALVLTANDELMRCWDMKRGSMRWSLQLTDPPDPLLRTAVSQNWFWGEPQRLNPQGGWDLFDDGPHVMTPARDLNRDGDADLVWASRHADRVVAISGRDGQVLWLATLGKTPARPDADKPPGSGQAGADPATTSVLAAPPVFAGDLNEDGIPDLVATAADPSGEAGGARRWVEALSGRTGEMLWSSEIADRWFTLPPGAEAPETYRDYGSAPTGMQSRGGGWSQEGDVVRRSRGRTTTSGPHLYMPSGACRISVKRVGGPTAESVLALVAGQHVLTLAPDNGQPRGSPIDCGFRPGLPPLTADVDGDGSDELVLLEELPAQASWAGPSGAPRTRLGVVSLVQRRMLWSRVIQAVWPGPETNTSPVPRWPVIADLEGDGRAELLVPHGTSEASGGWEPSAWGELEIVDGRTGKPRWKRRLKTMDAQVDHFLAGPDVDGDGVRDVFAATLWGTHFDLYIDALSGGDGRTLWMGRQRLRPTAFGEEYRLAPPHWWQAGNDGWPQMVVPVSGEESNPQFDLVYTFSAGTGELVHQGSRLTSCVAADADGDGVEDLFGLVRRGEIGSPASQSLACFRGTRRERWRSIATAWSAAADLDGDGRRDLVRTLADGTMVAASSRNGQPLWAARLPSSSKMSVPLVAAGPRPDAVPTPWYLAESLLSASPVPDDGAAKRVAVGAAGPAAGGLGDLDGDGTADLLGCAGQASRSGRFRPLHAISGRTGRTLWSAEIEVTRIEDVLALDVRDLDRDGLPEVVFAAGCDWGFSYGMTRSSDDQQLWLAVLSGRRGTVVWKHALTRAYGVPPGAGPPAHGFDQGTLPLAYGDLDGDGVLDVIVPSETAQGPPQAELRAVSGKTGQPLWSRTLPAGKYPMTEIPPAAVTDLDQDGRADVVALELDDVTKPTGRIAWLRGLNGADGQEKWSTRFDVASSWGQIDSQETRQRCRPRPLLLRTAAGPPLIALNLWDQSERVVVVDAMGKTVSDFRLTSEQGMHRGEFRLWACDADGDGNDEILLANRDQLMAIPPRDPDRPLWQRPVFNLWSDEIEGVLPAAGGAGPSVVVRRVSSPGAVYALDAASGRMIWIAAAPTPRREGHQVLLDRKQVALLDAGRDKQPPHLFFQHQFVSRVCEASPPVEEPIEETGASRPDATVARPALAAVSRVPARLSGEQDDPRQIRRLPWAQGDGSVWDTAPFVASGLFYSLGLVYVPGAYVFRLIRDRRWSLRRLLLMPVVAAWALMAALAGGNDSSLLEPLGRALLAILFFPVCVAVVRLVRWAMAYRWRLVAGWLAATVLAAGLTAGVVLLVAQTQGMGLQPGERYAWDGWYWVWFFGAYQMCWLLTLALPVVGTFRLVARWRRVRVP